MSRILAALGLLACGVAANTHSWAAASVHGTIVDGATSQPLAGVDVEIDGGCLHVGQCGSRVMLVTDAAGAYANDAVLSGGVVVYAYCPPDGCNNAPQTQYLGVAEGGNLTADFALAPGATIRGTVRRHADGAPLGGIVVDVFTAQTSGKETVTAADGTYAFEQMTAGAYDVMTNTAASAAHAFQDQAYASRAMTPPSQGDQVFDAVNVSAGQTAAAIDFDLVPGASVAGTLIDRYTTDPLAFVTVSIHIYDTAYTQAEWIYREVTTDASGHYQLDGLPSTAPIYFGANASIPYYASSFYGCGDPCTDLIHASPLVLTAGATQHVDMSLFPGSVITGSVTRRADGQPIADAAVQAFFNAGLSGPVVSARGRTDAQGHYAISGGLSGIAVNVAVTQAHIGGASYISQIYNDHNCTDGACTFDGDLIAAPAYQVTPGVDFKLDAGGAIRGQVIAAGSNDGIAGYVTLYAANGTVGERIDSDADGVFTTSGLTPGGYYLSATAGFPSAADFDCAFFGGTLCSQPGMGSPVIVSGTPDVTGILIVLPSDTVFGSGFE